MIHYSLQIILGQGFWFRSLVFVWFDLKCSYLLHSTDKTVSFNSLSNPTDVTVQLKVHIFTDWTVELLKQQEIRPHIFFCRKLKSCAYNQIQTFVPYPSSYKQQNMRENAAIWLSIKEHLYAVLYKNYYRNECC